MRRTRLLGCFLLLGLFTSSLVTPPPVSATPRVPFNSFTASADDPSVNSYSLYTITFVTNQDITPTSKFTVNFPLAFDLTGIVVASSDQLNGGLGVTVFQGTDDTNNYVELTRDGTGTTVSAGQSVSITFGNVLNPSTVGSYQLDLRHAQNPGNSEGPISDNVSIVAGPLNHFTVTNTSDADIANQVAGTAFSIKITAKDQYSNTITSWTGTVNLSDDTGTLTPTSATISSGGTVTVANTQITKAQSNIRITASKTDTSGTSNFFTVTAGAVSSVKIVEGSSGDGTEFTTRSVTTDEVILLHAAGYDQYGNYSGDESVTWSVTGSIGTVSPGTGTSTTFNATSPGNGTVVADHATVTDDATGTITVSVGALAKIKILSGASGETAEVTTASVTNGNTLTVHAGGFDADDNYRSDEAVDWSVSGGIGTVSPTTGNTSTTFTATNPGTGIISATNGSLSDDTGTITVDPGALAQIILRTEPNNGGSAFGAYSMTADQSVTVYAAGYDGQGYYLGDQNVDWTSTGTLAPTVNSSGQSSFTFSPTVAPASGTIVGTLGALSDATGTISVSAGALNQIKILSGSSGETSEITTASLTSGNTLDMHAGGYDADGNYRGDESVTWSVLGGIGTVSPSSGTATTFTATIAGTGQVSASNGTQSDVTGDITVTGGGSLSYIRLRTETNGGGVELDTYTMTADETLTLYAAGYDAGGTYVGDQPVDWSGTGTLAPTISASGQTSFTFSPTTAPASGTIVGTHASVGSDATGTITVNPGVPVGSVTLIPVPSVLDADGTSTSTISSSKIYDSDNNLIGSGREFTIQIVPSGLGTITSADVNANRAGVQIASDANSELSFQYTAGTAGGTATIFATSDDGSATGDTTITLTGLEITEILAPATVSRGQNGAEVVMTVKNSGAGDVTINSNSATLSFSSGAVDRNSNYTVTRTDAITTIPSGGAPVNLTFDVDVKETATLDTITIDGSINGTVSGTSVSVNGATQTDDWIVQRKANLRVDSVQTPATIDQGQRGISVSVTVSNLLDAQTATALIDSIKLVFRNSTVDVSSQYIVIPDANNPDTLAGGATDTFLFTVDVTAVADTGTITIDAEAYGRDGNSLQAVDHTTGAISPGSWVVRKAGSFQIASITPSQPAVTTSMSKAWSIRMAVSNTSGSNITPTLDKSVTFIRLLNGSTDVTDEYVISQPYILSGAAVIGPDLTETVVFDVTATGTTPGAMTITGRIEGTVEGTGAQIIDDTGDGGKGAVTVQTPADLAIAGITTPGTATQGQTVPWTIAVNLVNNGGSTVTVSLPSDSTKIFLSDTTGYDFTPPDTLAEGGLQIPGLSTAQLIYRVDSTGLALGTLSIGANVRAVEDNTGRVLYDSTSAQEEAKVTIQTAAALELLSTVVTSPNAPNVNKGQSFTVDVTIANTGQEQVDSLVVALSTDGQSIITAPAAVTIVGGSQQVISVPVTAAAFQGVENFTASIDTVRARNTGYRPPVTIVDNTAFINIQDPASLTVLGVAPSDSVVSANQTANWYIYVGVRNNGDAGITFNPRPEDVTITMNGQPTNEFIIDVQNTLKNRSDLTLPGAGTIDTLVYIVDRTGTRSGTADISVAFNGIDQNNEAAISGSGSTSVAVQENSAIRITTTVPQTLNLESEDVGLVNTSQVYAVRVNVENSGLEAVQNVELQLEIISGSGSVITSPIQTVPTIGPSTTRPVDFEVTAGNQENLTGEVFRAKINSATIAGSGNPATIDDPFDATTKIITQSPALLRLSGRSDPANGLLTAGQTFTLTVAVENDGTAGFDNSGELQLNLRGDYTLAPGSTPLTAPFSQQADSVTWTILAPDTAEPVAKWFTYSFAQFPNDLNTGSTVQTVGIIDSLQFFTDTIWVAIDSVRLVSPAGARDDTVSTEQEFTVQAFVNGGLDMLKNTQATLYLPAGYAFPGTSVDSQKVAFSEQNIATWDVLAPIDATGTSDFIVRVFGVDGVGQEHLLTMNHKVTSVTRATLRVLASIPELAGQTSVRLAAGQEFVLRAEIQNLGDAGVFDSGELTLSLGETNISLASGESLVKTVNDVNSSVEWNLVAPSQPTAAAPLSVRMTRTPKDENTGLNAFASIDSRIALLEVSTRQLGTVMVSTPVIKSPIGATDFELSTEQTFTVGTNVTWSDADNVKVWLAAPPGYQITDAIKSLSTSDATGSTSVDWLVTAPGVERSGDSLKVFFSGADATSSLEIRDSTAAVFLDVVTKASYTFTTQIAAPNTARDGKVSPDQEFTVEALLINNGVADIVAGDSSSIQITVPTGYSLADTLDSRVKKTAGEAVTWQVRAPSTQDPELRQIELRVISLARDENTIEPVPVDKQAETIPITTESSNLEVREILLASPITVAQGQAGVELLELEFANLGSETSSNIILQSLTVDFVDHNGEPVQLTDFAAALTLYDTETNTELTRLTQLNGAQVTLQISENNGVLQPGNPRRIQVRVDLREDATQNSFSARVAGVESIVAIDADSRKQISVSLKDANGQTGQGVSVTSSLAVLINKNLAEGFHNFPNPFTPFDENGNQQYTNFKYVLEQDSDVTLQIFTLFGELVYEVRFTASDPQGQGDGRPKTIRWDGKNGLGKVVMSGVYLAVLRTRSQTVSTKVAVIR